MQTEWDFDNRPVLETIWHGAHELRRGDRVRIRSQRRADIMDLALDGRVAVIVSIEQDLENRVHLAVVFDDDPGADLGRDRFIGHRFFFSANEVEPCQYGPGQ